MRAKHAKTVRTKILGALFHGAVNVDQGGRQIDQDKRKIVNTLHKNDPVQPFHKRNIDAEIFFE